MKSKIFQMFLGVLTVVGITVVFATAMQYGLCVEDDYDYVLGQAFVTGGLSLANVRTAFSYVGDSIWMPLTWISYMIDHSAGWGVFGAHGVNIGLHAANAAILFALLVRIFDSRRVLEIVLVWIATLTWALHPLRVESVVWIASRKDELSTLFVLLGLFAWTRNRRWPSIALSLVFLCIAAMAKPSAMLFPVFALPIDCLITRERKPVWAYAVMILLSVVIAIEGSVVQGVALKAGAALPIWYRVVGAVAALSIYLEKLMCPTDLAIQCTVRYPHPPRYSLVGLVLLSVIVYHVAKLAWPRIRTCIRTRDWRVLTEGTVFERLELACCAMFFLGLLPFTGLVGFGYHAFADRFTLLPQIAVSVFICGWVIGCLKDSRRMGVVCLVGACAVGLLARETRRQIGYWENDGVLFEHTIAVDGDRNTTAHRAAGIYYWNSAHDVEKVYKHLKKAIDISSAELGFTDMFSCCHLLIDAAYELGRVKEAEDYLALMSKWNYTLGEGSSMEYLMAEGLYYAQRPDMMDRAEANLRRLRRSHPNLYDTRYLAYYLARKRGDPEEIAAALRDCPTDGSDDSYNRNDWARTGQNVREGLHAKWYTTKRKETRHE